LCDIVDYSLRKRHVQLLQVEKLWERALAEDWIRPGVANQGHVHIWGTGDGFYLVDRTVDLETFTRLYAFSFSLIRSMADEGIELRVALHFGHVAQAAIPYHGKHAHPIAGTGLNTAARIVGFAAGGQIVFSEQFCVELDEVGVDNPAPTWPAAGVDALSITVKHGIRRQVRFSSEDVSPKMAHILRVSYLIEAECKAISQQLVRTLSREDPLEIRPRLTIFQIDKAKTPEGGELKDTGLRLTATRWRFCDDKSVPDAPGRTSYSIDPPVGLGISFMDRAARALVHLPDWEAEPEAYYAAVEAGWSVPKVQIIEWQRKARSFLSIPMMISPDDVPPAGVLCIDCASSLSKYSAVEANEVAIEIGQAISGKLALLWRLLE